MDSRHLYVLIRHSYSIGSGAVIRFPQYQWRNPLGRV